MTGGAAARSAGARATALLVVPVLAMGLAACARDDGIASPVVPQVRVAEVSSEMVPDRLSVFGTVTHRSKADIYPRTEGRIVEIFAEEGDRVARAEPLAQVETVQLDISLEQARAAVESKRALLNLAQERLAEGRRSVEARLLGIEKMQQEVIQKQLEAESLGETLENRRRLFEVGGVPAGELEALETRYQGARTSLLQAQKDLEIARIGFRDQDLVEAGLGVPTREARRGELLVELNVRLLAAEVQVAEAELEAALAELSRVQVLREESLVRTPIAGVVGRRYLDLGEKASPGQLLYTVFDTDSLFAEVHVPEDELVAVRPGQVAELSLDQGEEELSLSGRVALITPFVDPQSRATRVRILLDNQAGSLVPGMFLRGSVEVGPPQRALTLPRSAVALDRPEGNEVLLLRDRRVFRQVVETGEVLDGRIVILDGLREGELVVADATRSLPEGSVVEVVE